MGWSTVEGNVRVRPLGPAPTAARTGHDRVGLKPLYIYRDAEKLVFGSEIKAILACPALPGPSTLPALEDYLAYGMVPGPGRFFWGSKSCLRPMCLLSGRKTYGCRRTYWRLWIEPDVGPSVEQWEELTRASSPRRCGCT